MSDYKFTITEDFINTRLDKALSELSSISRSKLLNIIKNGDVTVNNQIIKDGNYKLQFNDLIEIIKIESKPIEHITPFNKKLNIVYEDEDLIIIDKEAGLTVHPGAGNHTDTLVNALIYHYKNSLSAIGGEDRPGIVHRLDRDTSGLMIVAKNDNAHKAIAHSIEKREVKRIYKAFVWGNINPSEGTIETNIIRSSKDRTRMSVTKHDEGKFAITHYKTIKSYGYISLIECKLETGRTHQIRVHLSHIGHSVVGDQIYGHNSRKIIQYYNGNAKELLMGLKRQALHSYFLEFIHPTTKILMSFQSELPKELQFFDSIL